MSNPITKIRDLVEVTTGLGCIGGPGAWDRNDWVWVVEFQRVDR